MNSKQYFRLTIVLIISFIILSWWLSQQDFIFERGQQVTCDVGAETCELTYSFPLKHYDEIKNGSHKLRYSTYDRESLVLLENFKYPIKATYFDEVKNEYVVALEIGSKELEKYNCQISGFYGFNYHCSLDYIPFDRNSGRLQLVNENDSTKFHNLISTAKKELKKSEITRIWIAISIFAGLFICYLILSFLVKFIIYGIKQKNL